MIYSHFDAKHGSLTYRNEARMYVITGMWHIDKYCVVQLSNGIYIEIDHIFINYR